MQKKEEYERKFGQAENVIGDTSSSHLDGMTVPLMNGPFPQANFRGKNFETRFLFFAYGARMVQQVVLFSKLTFSQGVNFSKIHC